MLGTDETFERCARWLLERPGCGWYVVHGTVKGRGHLSDEEYQHAWLELPGKDIALDMTTERPILIGRDSYMEITSAKPIAQYDCAGIQLALELHSNYGPWEKGESKPPEPRCIH